MLPTERCAACYGARPHIVRSALTVAVLCALTFGTIGCARSSHGQPASTSARPAIGGPIPLRVVNRGPSDAVVHAVRGSFRQRLGLIRGLATTELIVPTSITADRGTFVLVVNQVGGPEQYVSDAVAPQPDIRLVLLLNARFASSTLSVE